MSIQPSFWRSIGKSDAAFLTVVNRAFHTNLPNALSAQTWLTSMGYYSNWVYTAPAPWGVAMMISSGFGNILLKSGQTWAWGYNTKGQLGNNSTVSTCIPVSIQGAKKTFCKVYTSSSEQYSFGIDKNGQIWGWGYNYYGMLGDNSTTSKCTPVSIQGNKKTFCQISAGSYLGFGIDKNGILWGWGYNNFGCLGDNSTTSKRTPISIQGNKKTFCQISIGTHYHSSGIDYKGQAWGWGYNKYGQLGNNSIICTCTPVSIQGAKKTFCQISVGNDNVSAIDKNGQIWCWGLNGYGELGDNSTVSRCTPVSIKGAKKTFCQISTGKFHYTLGLDNNGQIWGWGSNVNGYLGNNSTSSICTPVSIQGAKKTFCYLSAGVYNASAIDYNGHVWTWGVNNYGQLGDNTTLQRLTPVRVCNF